MAGSVEDWEQMKKITPRGYVCGFTEQPLVIDGRLDKPAWLLAPWTEDFVDIEGSRKPQPRFRTRAKMLWDDEYLYIAAELEEPHVMGTVQKHDAVIFVDNDFEVFINPDGNNHNYYELEMNALNTTWDLFMSRPYKDGGKADDSFELSGMKTKVRVRGTVNDPVDKDEGWCVEIAIPWMALGRHAKRHCPPHDGDQWRIDFSRVEWKFNVVDGKYVKVPNTHEDNWVWSPQGIIDMHRPERWGYVQFSKEARGKEAFVPDPTLRGRDVLMEVYHRQKSFHEKHGRWAATPKELDIPPLAAKEFPEPIELKATNDGYQASLDIPILGGATRRFFVRQDSLLWVTHDQPWEGNCCGYHTVFQDGDLYRMYYRGMQAGDSTAGIPGHPPVVCYAESKDGIHWIKPELGLFEFLGSKKNNIVRLEPTPEGFAVFKDANPACAAGQRYKALTAASGGLVALTSPDGLHWSKLEEKPVITNGAFDSMNLAFWDSTRRRYVEFHRHFRNGLRDIMTSTSTDFLHWTEPVWLEYPGAAREQLYTNGVRPYPGAEHLFVGFPVRYMASRPSSFIPYKGVSPTMNGITDALFMTSRDGLCFHRWGEALIRPGLQSDCWVTRNNYPAWGVVITKSDTPEGQPEFSLYATEGYYRGGPCRLRRLTARIDGFASIHAMSRGGEMLTRPLTFAGKVLEINYSTSAAGSVRVEIQDVAGRPLPGFTLPDCAEIFGDEMAHVVHWKIGSDVSSLRGKPVRLRLVVKDADLFAIQFHD